MSPKSTNALVVTRHGGTEVLEVQPWEIEDPGPGQLLVRVAAAGVNFIDVYQRQGIYPTRPPFVACGEGAGTVEAVGPDVTETKVGDRVAWPSIPGSAAGFALVAEDRTVPVPDSVDSKTAAAAMLQGITAQYLVNSTYPIGRGDVALVHAAAGGVGQLLVQMIKAKGGRVVATAGSAAKLAIATKLGADHAINYRETTDLAHAVRGVTDGVGVTVVYDGVGKSTFDASLGSLKQRGMVVLFGASSGQVPPFDIQRLNSSGSLYLTRPTVAHYIATRAELLERGTAVLTAIGDRSLHIAIGGEYPIAEAARAYDDLEGRNTTGKLLLIL